MSDTTPVLLSALLVLVVVVVTPGIERAAPVAVDAPAPAPAGVVAPIELMLVPPAPTGRFARELETAGLVTALFERRLADVHGVVPVVAGAPTSPGLAQPLPVAEAAYNVEVIVDGSPAALGVGLRLCDGWGSCSSLGAIGTREDPYGAVARVVRALAAQLERPILADDAHWATPESEDPYARLLTGRSAAVFYGIQPAPAPHLIGNVRLDPVARATFLDPGIATAQWLQGRRAASLADGDPVVHLARAASLEPGSAVLWADEAAIRTARGESHEAWASWQQVDRLAPRDGRFVIPRAEAALAVGEGEAAWAMLERLDDAAQQTAVVAALRVSAADAIGEGSEALDDLLARWQQADPVAPEPVRQRIALRVERRDYADALALAPELENRGAEREAHELTVALAAHVGEWALAASTARQLGFDEVAVRLEATAAGQSGAPAPQVADLEIGLARVEVLLARGERHGSALARGQNDWVARAPSAPCGAATQGAVAVTRRHGQAQRDVLQRTREEAAQLAGMLEAPTVRPLASELHTIRARQLRKRLGDDVDGWLASAAWQRQVLEPRADRCDDTPALRSPGATR